MAMACRQCGDCCDPVLLRATKRSIRSDRSLEGDEFILAHWHRILENRSASSPSPAAKQPLHGTLLLPLRLFRSRNTTLYSTRRETFHLPSVSKQPSRRRKAATASHVPRLRLQRALSLSAERFRMA
jgi:hypothetical protein